MEGLFLVALGLIAIFVGFLNAFPLQRLNPRLRRPTAYLRGRERGGYVIMGFGALLILIGLIAVALHLVGITGSLYNKH
jgi:hypothetical protein